MRSIFLIPHITAITLLIVTKMKKINLSNDLVGYSRAGDAFHYRWAARRCLRLIDPNTILVNIVIEGSNETGKAGEYVIDVSEYSKNLEGDRSIEYYQLKHTTVRGGKAMTLSDLKKTLEGFADRFRQHARTKDRDSVGISFSVVTNRKVSGDIKDQLIFLAMGESVDARFRSTLEKNTKLKGKALVEFCALIDIQDSEGDYNVQNAELKTELSQLVAGTVANMQVVNLIDMVSSKVLPGSDHSVNREEVLKRFGVTNERDLFPAPPLWEKMDKIIGRKQHVELIRAITESGSPVIVHAAGGVGKTVFSRQLISSIPDYSLTIAYDCFGAGSYRNRSSFRHRYRDALVQISNELATLGLCQPYIVYENTQDDNILRGFLQRIESTADALRKRNRKAQLFIVIDAADNAEMAAEEFKDNCFAHELLREKMPKDCQLVMLCRTERIELLNPVESVLQLELKPFSEQESLYNLQGYFPSAVQNDGKEFHRLTGGNPRVQANALSTSYSTVIELLSSFGPNPMTVEMQIEKQLSAAVSKIKDYQTPTHQNAIHAICVGLSSLPPHIPIEILAKAAGVADEAIKSFVADMGRPLWINDSSVQFRDEPTETWFRKTFLAKNENYITYIERLEPLAARSTYVAEVLPQLYLQTGEYDKLIRIALSDELLPIDNPIDARNVRVFRLRFAFIAALKSSQTKDAVQVAMRAGEEVAGNNRQFHLFKNNLDLLALLQGKEKVQEIAFKSKLRSGWDGSENIYTASLLSGIAEYKGEARGYLRAADNWLSIYFKNKKKEDNDDDPYDDKHKVNNHDILEYMYAHLNVHGVAAAVTFLNKLKPKEFVFRVVIMLAERLIDTGRFEELQEFAEHWKNEPYYAVAISHELLYVGKFVSISVAKKCLDKLCDAKTRIPKPKEYFFDDHLISSVISFIEACFHYHLDPKKINAVLAYYVPERANRMVGSKHGGKDRFIFSKTLAMRMILSGVTEIETDLILPSEFQVEKKGHDTAEDIKEFKEYVDGMLPWFVLRANVLRGTLDAFKNEFLSTATSSHAARKNRYNNFDPFPKEITGLLSSILILGEEHNVGECYLHLSSGGADFNSETRLALLRAAYRSENLESIRDDLEQTTYELIESFTEEGPEEIAARYISLSRAVVVHSVPDSCVYFNKAIEIVSKFGDELMRRWEALEGLAEKASRHSSVNDEFAYRFMRCAELIGLYMQEKHWDRSNAARIGAKMSPATAIAGVSRWRDRIVGRYQYQLLAVVKQLLEREQISAGTGWSLSHLFGERLYGDLAILCIEQDKTTAGKQAILDDAVRTLQIEGVSRKYADDLSKVAQKFKLSNQGLTKIEKFHGKEETAKRYSEENTYFKKRSDVPDKIWDSIFDGITIDTLEGLTKLWDRYKVLPKDRKNYHSFREVLLDAVARLKQNEALNFLDALFVLDNVEIYDVKAVLFAIPDSWKNKLAYKAKWPALLKKFGKQFSHELASKYIFDHCVEDMKLSPDLFQELNNGIYEGLHNENALNSEEVFFGFSSHAVSFLSPEDAFSLTDYSVGRFELHMEEKLGDGPYSNALSVDGNIPKSVAGFIWSALGSPWSWERWKAAHAVRSLAELNCIEIIDELFIWMNAKDAGAYGSAEFEFYTMHAKQYFLIALARVSLSHPKILNKYSQHFSEIALTGDHVLMQKFAKDIALNLEAAIPGTYKKATLAQLNKIGKSPYAVQQVAYNYRTDSPKHQRSEVDTTLDFHFGYDFDKYWFEPLGDLFGISGKQVEELAAEVVVKEWGMGSRNGYNQDPRVGQWNRSSRDRETWHDHGSYPRADRLDFYLSYHAMLVVAGRLFKMMPLVKTSEWSEDVWNEWLSRHLLTIESGEWLSDVRDPLPMVRPEWITKEKTDTWQTDIGESDFRKRLIDIADDEVWITVRGGWHEKISERKEDVFITSAFVCTETADALSRALQSCKDHHDYKIPNYQEDDMEVDTGKFRLKGWIEERSVSKGLDQFDSLAADISYPLYTLGDSILKDLKLDQSFGVWTKTNNKKVVMRAENWSTDPGDRDEYTDQGGMRMRAKLGFLKEACRIYKSDLIIEMVIDRDIIVSKMGGSNSYGKPFIKILIVSADGTVRTTEGNFSVR